MTGVLAPVAAVLEAGLREGVAPCLSAAVLRGGAEVHASFHGTIPTVDAPGGRPLREGDLFDVASLTKVMATATLVAQAVAEGGLALDEPVARRLRGFEAGGKEAVTARHLLAHTSGLPWWRPYFEQVMASAPSAFLGPESRPLVAALQPAFLRGKEIVRAAVLAERLEAAPGTRAVYSDPGFLALGFLLEEVLGDRLAALAEARVFLPLGLGSTGFLDDVAPQEASEFGRGRTFVPSGDHPTRTNPRRPDASGGWVNDDNAWAMGGGAGHAGVFSTARDVARLGQAWLDGLHGRRSVVPAAVAAEFARRDPTPGSTRALGWDTPSAEGSSLGTRLGRGGRGAIGHLGFTGTSLWIDVAREVVVALLTNRVHPSAENERIRAFRPRFHDAVAEAVLG